MSNSFALSFGRLVAIGVLLPAVLGVGMLLISDARALNCKELNERDVDAEIVWAYERSDFVFVGRPQRLDRDLGPTDVKVAEYWKGPNLATIPMGRSFWEADERVIFASRSPVGGWLDTGPECVYVSSDELKSRLSRLFGSPVEPSPGNREENELLIVGCIFLLSGFLAIGVWAAIGRLRATN